MGGTDQQVVRDMVNDPVAMLSLLSVALPNVYNNGQRVLTPGRFVGQVAQQYDQARTERGLGDILNQMTSQFAGAHVPPWERANQMAAQDPEVGFRAGTQGQTGQPDVPGIQKPGLGEQAKWQPEMGTLAGFLEKMTPQQRRLAARQMAGRGAEAGGFEGLFDRMNRDMMVQDAMRKQLVYKTAAERWAKNPLDQDAANAMMSLMQDPVQGQNFSKDQNKLQADVSLLAQRENMSPEDALRTVQSNPQFVAQMIERAQLLKESVDKQKGMIDTVRGMPGMDPDNIKVMEGLAKVGALTDPVFNAFLQNGQTAKALLDVGKEFQGALTGLFKKISLSDETLKLVTDRFPQYAPMIMDLQAKAAEVERQQAVQWAQVGLQAKSVGLADERLKLEASAHQRSLRDEVLNQIKIAQHEEAVLATQKSTIITGPDRDEATLLRERRAIDSRMRLNQVKQQQLWVKYNMMTNPELVLHLENYDVRQNLEDIQARQVPIPNKVSALNEVQRALNRNYEQFLNKAPGGAQFYQSATQEIMRMRDELLGAVVSPPVPAGTPVGPAAEAIRSEAKEKGRTHTGRVVPLGAHIRPDMAGPIRTIPAVPEPPELTPAPRFNE